MAQTHKNPNKHTKTERESQVKSKGRKVMYLGNGTTTTCPTCSKKQSRGMVSEYQGTFYCSERCIPN